MFTHACLSLPAHLCACPGLLLSRLGPTLVSLAFTCRSVLVMLSILHGVLMMHRRLSSYVTNTAVHNTSHGASVHAHNPAGKAPTRIFYRSGSIESGNLLQSAYICLLPVTSTITTARCGGCFGGRERTLREILFSANESTASRAAVSRSLQYPVRPSIRLTPTAMSRSSTERRQDLDLAYLSDSLSSILATGRSWEAEAAQDAPPSAPRQNSPPRQPYWSGGSVRPLVGVSTRCDKRRQRL